jgi:hypothetical protein
MATARDLTTAANLRMQDPDPLRETGRDFHSSTSHPSLRRFVTETNAKSPWVKLKSGRV